MKKKSIIIIAALIFLTLAGCGSASKASSDYAASEPAMYDSYEDYDDYSYNTEMVTEEAMGDYVAGEEEATVTESDVEGGANQNQSRMLIKTVNMNVETEDVDVLTKNIENRVNSLGGYIESLNVSTTSRSDRQIKNANIIARVPVEKLDSFVDEVEGKTNVLSKDSNAEDVTLKYVDMQSKMDSLKTEYDKISELLEKADDLDSIIALQSRLTEIRYQIESYGSQLKVMKNQASYSTINLNITQVVEYTPVVVKEQTRIEKMVTGFWDNCKSVWNGILDFLVGLVIALPILIVWGIVIFIIVIIIRAIAKRKDKDEDNNKKRSKRIKNTLNNQNDKDAVDNVNDTNIENK